MTIEGADGFYDLGPSDQVPSGTVKGFSVADRRIAVAHLDDRFVGFDELCPHLSIPLSQGALSKDCLTCVGHGSVFELPSGAVRKWMGRRPGLISSLLSGKPMPIDVFEVVEQGGNLRIATQALAPRRTTADNT